MRLFVGYDHRIVWAGCPALYLILRLKYFWPCNAKPFSPPKTHDTTGAQLDNQATLFTFSTSSINQNWHNNEWTENYETEVYMSFLQILVSTTELKSTTKCRFCKDNYLKTCSIGCKIETDQKIWILLARSASRLSLSQHLNAYYLILYLFSQNVGGGGAVPPAPPPALALCKGFAMLRDVSKLHLNVPKLRQN